MRSRSDEVDVRAAVDRGLALGLCGVGGRLPHPPPGLAAAVAAVRRDHGDRVADRLDRFAAVPDGAYVWTRRADDLFVGRLTEGWTYDASPQAHALDLTHVRACTWVVRPVDPPQVPAAVLASFARGGRNFQRIRAADPVATARVWHDGVAGG